MSDISKLKNGCWNCVQRDGVDCKIRDYDGFPSSILEKNNLPQSLEGLKTRVPNDSVNDYGELIIIGCLCTDLKIKKTKFLFR